MQIRIENIHFTYPGGVKALDGISLNIQPGEKLALVGANGSGKTTLARHLIALLRPQQGNLWVGDWQTSEHSPAQLARRVAYVFQNPDEQLFRQSVRDEVAFGPQNLGYPPLQVEKMVDQALSQMGLSQVSDYNPRDLGYAGRKRVTLASALAMQTPILVFDEPTASLDTREQQQFAQVLETLQHNNKTILIISHDMDFLAENADRIILMQRGKIVRDASVQQFFEDDRQLQVSGLVAPQITRLSRKLGHPRLALDVEQFLNQLERKTGHGQSKD